MVPNHYFVMILLGLRGSVRITNNHSVAVSYQWCAMEGVDPDIFSATHPSGSWLLLSCIMACVVFCNCLIGVVPARCSLECEFVCLPSYDCPTAAQFLLAVGDQHSTSTTEVDNCVLTLVPKGNNV